MTSIRPSRLFTVHGSESDEGALLLLGWLKGKIAATDLLSRITTAAFSASFMTTLAHPMGADTRSVAVEGPVGTEQVSTWAANVLEPIFSVTNLDFASASWWVPTLTLSQEGIFIQNHAIATTLFNANRFGWSRDGINAEKCDKNSILPIIAIIE